MPDKNITFHLKRKSDIPTQTQSYYTVAIISSETNTEINIT